MVDVVQFLLNFLKKVGGKIANFRDDILVIRFIIPLGCRVKY